MLYGLNYQGSKNKICDFVINHISPAKNFYDLFCGGSAMSHAALLSGKFKQIIQNDLNPLSKIFSNALNNQIPENQLFRWISREEFKNTRKNDPVAAFCWSFGGNLIEYLYSKEIEPFKHALHLARVENNPTILKEMGCNSPNRSFIVSNIETVKENYINWYLHNVLNVNNITYADFKNTLETDLNQKKEFLIKYLNDAFKKSGLKSKREVGILLGNNMNRHYFGNSQWAFPTEEIYNKMKTFMPLPYDYAELVNVKNTNCNIKILQNLKKLNNFYSLENYSNARRVNNVKNIKNKNLTFFNESYENIKIQPNSIIYLDPPYKNTASYESVEDFNHDKFYEFCLGQKELTIISEYSMPETDFLPIAQITINCTYSATNNAKKAAERLFIPKKQHNLYKQKQGLLF